jgi:hypothetical protein
MRLLMTMRSTVLAPGASAPIGLPRPAALRTAGTVLIVAVGGCSAVEKPGPQSIVGMSPVGTVSISEITVAGGVAGKGRLEFRGRSYPFKLAGGVAGPGGAAETNAFGQVYNLSNVADFAGVYTQSSGGIGLSTSGASELWLRNTKGVVMHLRGSTQGMTLSLGREEVIVEMF